MREAHSGQPVFMPATVSGCDDPNAAIEPRFVSYIVEAKDGRTFTALMLAFLEPGGEVRRGQAHHVFIRHHHQLAAIDFERHLQRRMRRPWKRRTPVVPGDEFRLRHVLDVENDEAAPPVTRVEPVADAQQVGLEQGGDAQEVEVEIALVDDLGLAFEAGTDRIERADPVVRGDLGRAAAHADQHARTAQLDEQRAGLDIHVMRRVLTEFLLAMIELGLEDIGNVLKKRSATGDVQHLRAAADREDRHASPVGLARKFDLEGVGRELGDGPVVDVGEASAPGFVQGRLAGLVQQLPDCDAFAIPTGRCQASSVRALPNLAQR